MTVTIKSVSKAPGQLIFPRRYVVADINAPHWLWEDVVESDRYVATTRSFTDGSRDYEIRRTSDGSYLAGRAHKLLSAALKAWDQAECEERCVIEAAQFVKEHAQ